LQRQGSPSEKSILRLAVLQTPTIIPESYGCPWSHLCKLPFVTNGWRAMATTR
jgi:hypothetical protein